MRGIDYFSLNSYRYSTIDQILRLDALLVRMAEQATSIGPVLFSGELEELLLPSIFISSSIS